jgi:hypothetical protein
MKENLFIIIDLNTNYFFPPKSNDNIERISIQELLTSIMLFINNFLALSHENSLFFYSYDSHSA